MNNPFWFDEGVYLKNKAVECGLSEVDTLKAIYDAGMNPFQHYVVHGEREGVSPNELFNPVQYARAVAESWNESSYKGFSAWNEIDVLSLVQGFGVTLYDHFQNVGWLQNLNASNTFDVSAYMQDKAIEAGLSLADTINAFITTGVDAVTHYMIWGKNENIPITAVSLEDTVRAASTFNAQPNDPLFAQQWHLQNTGQVGGTPGVDLNVIPAWNSYSGNGVIVAVVDQGLEFTHPDLAGNIDTSLSFGVGKTDGQPVLDNVIDAEGRLQYGDNHGIACGGLVGAVGDNGIGGLGIAPDATLASIYITLGRDSDNADDAYKDALVRLDYDILSNSWGDFSYPSKYKSIEEYRKARAPEIEAALHGRDGKGSVVLFAAGNDNDNGQDVALGSDPSSYTIAVGGVNKEGHAVTYSSPGSQVLVSAPTMDYVYDSEHKPVSEGNVVTTDRQGEKGYNQKPSPEGDDCYDFSGTSAACPMVAGVAALILDANPELGYRDVSNILALSARNTDPDDPRWVENGADNWNGGGLSHHRQMGYGLVDATAAVRLAETWTEQNTETNKMVVSRHADINAMLPDGGGRILTSTVMVEETIQLEKATVFVNLQHKYGPDVELRLVSPSGTVSTLLNTSVTDPDNDFSMKGLYVPISVAFLGENSQGTWTLELVDKYTNYKIGTVTDWTLELSGKADSADDTYFYTNDFARLAANPARTVLHDAEGYNTINTAAVSTDVYMDLRTGGDGGWINNVHIALAEGTAIQRLFTGDGNDMVVTNGLGDSISTGRGNDHIIIAEGGNNRINGGTGYNTVQFFGNRADYDVQLVEGHYVVANQAGANELINIQGVLFADQTVSMDFMTQFA